MTFDPETEARLAELRDYQADPERRAEYKTWLHGVETTGRVPPLAEYLHWVGFDPNLPWRLGSGHLVGLLDTAVEALEAAYGTTNALRETLQAVLGTNEQENP